MRYPASTRIGRRTLGSSIFWTSSPLASRESHAAKLARLFRENPPFQPKRFYRLTRDGQWLRMADEAKFSEIKPATIINRVCLPSDAGR